MEKLAVEAENFVEIRQVYIEGNMDEDEFLEEVKRYVLFLQMYCPGESVFCGGEEVILRYLEKDKFNKKQDIKED